MNYTLHLPENYVKPPLPGRDEWIAALRSGEYRQCQQMLSNGEAYCCLGVLSKIQGRLAKHGNSTWLDGGPEGEEGVLTDSNPLYPVLTSPSECGIGPFPDYVWVAYGRHDRIAALTECNDRGLTFDQISDIIEAVWDHAPKNW